jgi:hypothetical protein
MSKDSAEDERKRRKQVEQQLLALQAEKQAAMAAAAKLVEGNSKRSSEYEAECAKLRAELEAIGKEKNSTISQGKRSMICHCWCLRWCWYWYWWS